MASIDFSTVRVTIDLPSIEIYADPPLEKVFYNHLMENSLRYRGHVSIIMIHSDETSDGLNIMVDDDGTRISTANKERIFNREYYKNTGFGLF